MLRNQKLPKPAGRDERHSAAWGKRWGFLVLLLMTDVAFAQRWNSPEDNAARPHSRLSSELRRAFPDRGLKQTVKVIVQYRQAPVAAHFARMQDLGGRLHARLHVVNSAAFTIPVSALAALEADPEVVSVTIDHPLNGLDDYSDAASNVSSAWSSGFDGSGIGVAVIDSGINDKHRDLWDATQTHSRVVYHQDFTGTPTTNSS